MYNDPFTDLGDDQWTRAGDYEKRNFLQWLTMRPRKLRVHVGGLNYARNIHHALYLLEPKLSLMVGEALSRERKVVAITKPPRHTETEN